MLLICLTDVEQWQYMKVEKPTSKHQLDVIFYYVVDHSHFIEADIKFHVEFLAFATADLCVEVGGSATP